MSAKPQLVEDDPLTADKVVKMLFAYGKELHDANLFTGAAVAFERAIAMDPESAEVWNGLGAACWNLGQYDRAERALSRSIALNNKSANSWANLGLLLCARQQWSKSQRAFERSLEIEPGNRATKWDYANMNLARGQWKLGLEGYEVRIAYRGSPLYPKMPYRMWDGENLDGKRLFIQAEQGIGDRIMMSRFIGLLRYRYPKVEILYLGGAQTHALFWGLRDLGVQFLPEGIPWPAADYGVFEMSLMRLLECDDPVKVPADTGYIKEAALRDARSVNLPQPHTSSLKVGLCWTGNPTQSRNWERSVPFDMLLELAALPKVTLYSLQMGPGRDDIRRHAANQLVCDLGEGMAGGFHRTAALIASLDLVITCCTSIAHLAGAVGVPTWTMLCHDPYWVWLRERETSVWYPSMKLYRQGTANDWRGVVDRIKDDLAAEIERRAI